MSNVGERKIYNQMYDSQDVLLWDVIEFDNSITFKFNIISTNSEYKQGIRLAIDSGIGEIEINGFRGKEFYLMEDTCPKDVIVKVVAECGKLSVYNVYERLDGKLRSLGDYSCMLVKQEENLREYRCKTSSVDDFDTLIFTMETVG